MEGWIFIILLFGVIFLLMALGVPIAFSIFAGGILGLWVLGGLASVISFFQYGMHHLIASYILAVGPLFILLGSIADVSGLGERVYYAFQKLLGQFRGGLLTATIGSCAVFGGISGSSIADAAVFSKIAIPELKKFGYQDELSFATIATAGALDVLIPPSMAAVIYCVLTNTSVGKVLIAGIIPGIINTLILMVGIYIRIRLNPKLAPETLSRSSWMEKLVSVIAIWPALAIVVIILGSIYTGFCTPSEAAAVGAIVVMLYAVIYRTRLKKLKEAYYDSVAVVAQIFIIIVGGQMLQKAVSLSGVSRDILTWMSSFSLFWVWVIFILVYFILGCILDPTSMMVLTLPICFPLMTKLGVDPIVLGIVVIVMVEIAVITPPVGFNCYVVAAMAGVDPEVVFRGVLPFVFMLFLMLLIVILYPPLTTWLPNLAFR